MSSPLISFMQRLQGPRLIALISIAIVLVVQLIVSGMSLLLQGKITTDYLLTGFVAASLAGPPSLWFIHSALDMLAQTQRRLLETGVWRAESRLCTAIEAAQMLFWELDLATGRLNYKDADLAYLGIATENAAHDMQSWIATIHLEEREIFAQHFLASSAPGGPNFDFEYRVGQEPGRWIWIHTRGKVIQRGTDGQALWASGSSMNIDARKMAELALRDREVLLHSILGATVEGVLMINQSGRVLAANRRFQEMWRIPEKIAQGSRDDLLLEFVLDQLAEPGRFSEQVQRLYQSDEEARDILQLKDGRLFMRLTRPLQIGDDRGRIWCFMDITEQEQAKTSLLNSKERLRMALDAAQQGWFDYDLRTGKISVNPEYAKTIGYDPDDSESDLDNWRDSLHPDDKERVLKELEKCLASRETSSVDYRRRNRQGDEMWIRSIGKVMEWDAQQKPTRMMGIHTVITARKQAEQALAESHNLLKSVIDTVPARVFWKDKNLRYLGCNPPFARNAGLSSQDELIGKDDFQMPWAKQAALYRADDLQVMESGIARIAYEEPQTTPDGHPIWLRTSRVPLRDTAGEVVGLLGLHEDITAQKADAEKLRLSALVLENSSEALVITDEQNRIMEINPAFTKLTGYARDEVIGQNPAILHSGRHEDLFYHKMWEEIGTRGFWRGEIWNRRKNGEIYAEWLTINTIFNPDGSVHRYVGLFSDITERKKSEELIWTQANFDPLTNLPNRRMFRDRLAQDLKKAHRAGLKLALLFLDLDRFKEVNDTLGHDKGDALLIEAAQRIAACVRESDTVARLGGDEFTIILAELDDRSSVERIATAILNALAHPFELGDESAYVSASIGITVYPDDASTLEAMLKNADQAMYVAKNSGRNRFSYFTSAMQEEALHRLHILNDLRGALDAGQFQLYYQPIVEIGSGKIFKAEALLRWFHPKRGLISPAQFIPLAEESGLIHEIGAWVFAQAASQAKQWASHYSADFQISVNKSPLQIQSNPERCQWQEYLVKSKTNGHNLVIEITESVLLDNSTTVTAELLAYRDAGMQVAIDDFGTGYSALSYLKKLDIDYVKLDQSFIRNLETDPSDKALSEAIVVMAHKLGLQVIAEGVETQAQLDLLAGMGCDFAQGFLYSRAIPAQEFEQLLLASHFGDTQR